METVDTNVARGDRAAHGSASRHPLVATACYGAELLRAEDTDLHNALLAEQNRQESSLSLVASSSVCDPSVLSCMSSASMNVTAEGYPGARYHAGCAEIDPIEQLAINRAESLFGARYVNVQPHSATTANYAVLSALLKPGDTVLGMALGHGGHLTHGYSVAYSGTYFRAINYGLDVDGGIDYDGVADLAREHRPQLIICGATAYPRTIDFARFRAIADETGALLMADISHIGGLVAADLHSSPIDHAHITTVCTHKQLAGPRGGLLMSGRDSDLDVQGAPLSKRLARAVFPYFQGAPVLPVIAGKARAFALADTDDFRATARRIIEGSAAIAAELQELGYSVVTKGTDNHIVLLDLSSTRLSGLVAEKALEEVGIVVNKNRVPGDQRPAEVSSGIRIGSNSAAQRGLEPTDMRRCARIIDSVLRSTEPTSERTGRLEALAAGAARADIASLTARFPLPRYVSAGCWSGH